MSHYRYVVTARRGHDFPDDMLRYDEAQIQDAEHVGGNGPLSVQRYYIAGKRTPTTERWNSFGWPVSAIENCPGPVPAMNPYALTKVLGPGAREQTDVPATAAGAW
jgi:hypothetical protein